MCYIKIVALGGFLRIKMIMNLLFSPKKTRPALGKGM